LFNFLRKHLGFAWLMAFVMGWSSVVSAQQNFQHQQMMTANAHQASVHAAHTDPSHSNMANCHQNQRQAVPEHAAHHGKQPTPEVISMMDCHQSLDSPSALQDGLVHHSTIQNTDCQDCTLAHCQISTSYVDSALVALQTVHVHHYTEPPRFHFCWTALKGFWQEILRPPQA
jgi:hypothetical protein